MTDLKRAILDRLGIDPPCGVKGCNEGDGEWVTLKALDPIDHDDTLVSLCGEHKEWADKRNALAAEMTEQLRQHRKEIGMDNIELIQEVAVPQGELREDILDGSATGMIPLSEAVDDQWMQGTGTSIDVDGVGDSA